MAKLREVSVPIGTRNYLMQTELDDDTLGRIVKIVNEACESISGNTDPDRKFMLVSLQLAYNLEKVSRLLESLDGRFNELKTTS